MGTSKFTDIELQQLVRQRLTCSQIAKHLGVSKGAVSMRMKKLNVAMCKDVAMRSAGEVVRRELDTVAQLQKINENANELLDLLMRWNRGDDEALQILESQVRKVRVGKGDDVEEIAQLRFKDPRELALKAMSEIRGQLKLQLEIFQALCDVQVIREFQGEVLDCIAEVAPELRDRIIRNLQERRAIYSTCEFQRGVTWNPES